jgi:hypothetical protein
VLIFKVALSTYVQFCLALDIGRTLSERDIDQDLELLLRSSLGH